MFFFFKPKTAYELRISDWSSDVCSSDLQSCIAVLIDDGPEESRRGGEVEYRVAGELAAETLIHCRVGEIAFQIADTNAAPLQVGIVLHAFVKRRAQLFVVDVMMADTDERQLHLQQLGPSAVDERGERQESEREK